MRWTWVIPLTALIISGCGTNQNNQNEELNHKEEMVIKKGDIKEDNKEEKEVEKTKKSNQDDYLILVNKESAIDENYKPNDLVVPEIRFPYEEIVEKRHVRKVAADALEKMFEAAEKENIILFGQSGYRSYERQVAIYNGNVQSMGEEKANAVSAKPGESEHQTGLVMDITSESVGFDVVEEFGETKEGKWVAAHAHEYGLIVRYPKGKEAITGYSYEPWHLRYVGEEVATEIVKKNLTLEEYLNQ